MTRDIRRHLPGGEAGRHEVHPASFTSRARLAEARGSRKAAVSVPGINSFGRWLPGSFRLTPITYLQGAPVSFGQAVKMAFRHGFALRGRASRSAYWWFALFQGAITFALWIAVSIALDGGSRTSAGSGPGLAIAIIGGIALLYLALAALTLQVRRLHDTGRSGWWLWIGLIPYAGAIVVLIFTLLKGTPGPNIYEQSEDQHDDCARVRDKADP